MLTLSVSHTSKDKTADVWQNKEANSAAFRSILVSSDICFWFLFLGIWNEYMTIDIGLTIKALNQCLDAQNYNHKSFCWWTYCILFFQEDPTN